MGEEVRLGEVVTLEVKAGVSLCFTTPARVPCSDGISELVSRGCAAGLQADPANKNIPTRKITLALRR